MVQGISEGLTQSSYGRIQRTGLYSGGRTEYRVFDSEGKDAGRLTVPTKQADKFEKAYADIMESVPKIQKYSREHSSQNDKNFRKNVFRVCTMVGGVLGAAIPLTLLRNSSSAPKQIIGLIGGIITGISAGFGASIATVSPPGTLKFTLASRKLSEIDIQPVEKFMV